MDQDSRVYIPNCCKTVDSKDKEVHLCSRIFPNVDLTPNQAKRKLFIDSPLRVSNLHSRTRFIQCTIIVGLGLFLWIQFMYNVSPAVRQSEKEFQRLERASEMLKILKDINGDVEAIYETLPSLYYDITGIVGHKEENRQEFLTADKILFDSASAEHVDLKDLQPALVRPRGWDIKLPVKGQIKGRKTACWTERSDLLCLPTFYLMGFPYSRTSDLYEQMQSHPDFVGAEPQQWWTRINFKVKISSVCRGYGRAMRNASLGAVLGELDENMVLHMMNRIPDEVVKNTDWHKTPAAPRLMTPYMIQAMRPEMKFVVVLQNPIDAVYIAFLNANTYEKRSAQLFHYRVVQLTNLYESCFLKENARACAYDPLLAMEANKAEIPLHTQFHAIVLADWLQVFPVEHFHFLRLEDYEDDKRTYLDGIYHFINLTGPDWKIFKPVKETELRAPGDLTEPMWPETRDLLRQFFKPHLIALSHILESESYLWNEYNERMK